MGSRFCSRIPPATYSTSSDLASVGAPLIGGLVASLIGVTAMFPLTAIGFFACFLTGDLVVNRWRAGVCVRRRRLAFLARSAELIQAGAGFSGRSSSENR